MNSSDFLSFLSPIVLIILGIMMKYSVNDGWSSTKKWWPYFIIGGVLLLIIKLFDYNSSQAEEKEFYQSFYESSKHITDDQSDRKAYAMCALENIKARNGNTLEGLTKERIDEISEEVVDQCARSITKIAWTQQTERAILNKVNSMEELHGVNDDIKDKYAQCILSKLKSKYPNGVKGQVQQETMDSIYFNCFEVMKSSTPK